MFYRIKTAGRLAQLRNELEYFNNMMPYLIVLLVPKGPKSTSSNACLDQLIRGYDLVEREITYLNLLLVQKLCFNAVLIISSKMISLFLEEPRLCRYKVI